MKKSQRLNGVAAAVLLAGQIVNSTAAAEFNQTVQQAYELRIQGKADAAETLLTGYLSENPTQAAAWYELARTRHHIGLGNPRTMIEGIDEQWKAIEQAVRNDPDNIIYAFYKAHAGSLRAYASFKMQKPDVRDRLEEAIAAYEAVLRLKPDFHEAKLQLIETLNAPADIGGNPAKAEMYTKELEEADPVFGAMAREIIMPDDADYIAFWTEVLENNRNNTDVLERLGKAYLYKNQPEQGIEYLKEAIRMDAGKNSLHLDIGRYYMYQAMRDPQSLEASAPKIEEAFNAYLQSKPDPINPMKAYVKYHLSAIRQHMGDTDAAVQLRNEAEALDPNGSKATGVPSPILFTPPNELPRVFTYYSRPF
ncbi:MAG TPA: tetratricopeptide repeat protein [Pontiella sp.]